MSSSYRLLAVGVLALGIAGCNGAIGAASGSSQSGSPAGSTAGAGATPAESPQRPHPSLPISFDDRYTTLATEAEVIAERQTLIETIWPSGALPTSLPVVTRHTAAEVGAAIPSSLDNLDESNILKLDFPTLNPMPPNGTNGGDGMAYLLSPLEAPRHRVVILNTGHTYTFDEGEDGTGMRNVVQALLTENYSVLLVYMPHFTPSDSTGLDPGSTGDHNRMFADGVRGSSDGDPTDARNYRYFFEPTILAINFLVSAAAPGGAFSDIALAGLSGGGWTTTLVSALDTRPRLSIAVAGSAPYYTEEAASMDAEQVVRSRLGIGYADLCVMGADGTAVGGELRRQTQVVNRRDGCCFGEAQYDGHGGEIGDWQSSFRLAELNVRAALFGIGSAGRWRLEIDEMADHHMVSANILHDVLLAELDDDRKLVAAASVGGSMFYRGQNGDLVRRTFPEGGVSTETDTGVAMAGVATAVEGGPNTVDVFARDSTAGGGIPNLIHYFLPEGQSTWVRETLPMVLVGDPVAVAGGRTYDVVGVTVDGALYRLSSTTTAPEMINPGPFAGTPAAVRLAGALHVLARGKNLMPYEMSWSGSTWVPKQLTLVLSGFPAAADCGDRICVAALGTDRMGRVGTIDLSGAWSGWSNLPGPGGLRGTPSLAGGSAGVTLYVSTEHGTLGRFAQTAAGEPWTFTELGTTVASPTAVQPTGGAVVSGGQQGALWIHRATIAALGGWFD